MGALPSGGRSATGATVAARSDAGPREVNEDRSFTALNPGDGSWVIAVADGLGGHPRGADAAEAAVAALAPRIASEADMGRAFVAAHRAVAALAASPTQWRFSPHRCPMATLGVAAWTPEGGLIVAHMGDTLPVLVSRPNPGENTGWILGPVHRNRSGSLSSCLGLDAPRTDPHRGGSELNVVTVLDDLVTLGGDEWAVVIASVGDWEALIPDPGAGEWAVVIASDGVWEKLVSDPDDSDTWGVDELAGRVAELVGFTGGSAENVAAGLLAAARDQGLDDNATVAVAHMAAVRRAP